MSPPIKGNPYLQVRMPQEVIDILKARFGESEAGKAGGVSLFVRRLVARELREPLPDGNLSDLLELAAAVEDEATWSQPGRVKDLFYDLVVMTHKEADPIRRNFAAQLLGTLIATAEEAGWAVTLEPKS